MFPLTLPELETEAWNDILENSIFQNILAHPESRPTFLPHFLMHKRHTTIEKAWEHYVKFGGYPALSDGTLTESDRYAWLSNYVKTYLERDIRDLGSLRDLEPFIKLQRYKALQTATQLNVANASKQIGVSAKTVQRYIRYLELSYQALVLPSWIKNQNKRLVKAPKIHGLDNGILQIVLQKRGGLTGPEFESLVVAEMYKQARCLSIDAHFHYLRTLDGREVDLLVELPEGYMAFEIKMAEKVSESDARHLKGLDSYLDKPLLHSFVLSLDPETHNFGLKLTALHAAHFLG